MPSPSSFVTRSVSLLLLLAGLASLAACAADKADQSSAAASAAPLPADPRLGWWTNARFGMFIHWGLYAIPAGKWGDKDTYGEWIRSSAQIPVEQYDRFVPQFNPTAFDADAIVRTAKEAGMGYIVITTKHHDGFCLFDSAQTDFDVMSTPFKRDIMAEMAQACRRHGLKICWYYSIMDWHHPDYLPRREWETNRPTTGADFDRYLAYMKAQLRELLTKYGDIGVVWFDGQWEGQWNDQRGRDLYNYVRSISPNVIVNSRVGRAGGDWGLDRESGMLGDFATPEQAIPDTAPVGLPWETCMTMNDHWGFNAADLKFKPTRELVRMLIDIASKGGNFLLNVGPTAEGRIPDTSVQRLAEIGRWMSVNGVSIRGTKAGPFGPLPWGRCTQSTGAEVPRGATRLYFHVFEKPADGRLVVPGLLSEAIAAYPLAAPDRFLKVARAGDDLVIDLGAATQSDGLPFVVALDIQGEPDLTTPPLISAPAMIFSDSLQVTIASQRRNVSVHCTTDGSEPTLGSTLVSGPLTLSSTATVKARCFRAGKPVSPVAQAVFQKVQPRPGVTVPGAVPGVNSEYFQWETGDIKAVADMAGSPPVRRGASPGFDFSSHQRERYWGYRWTGYIRVPRDGVYRFATSSDDGSRMWVDDQLVVDNDGPHSFKQERGDIALAAGLHPITLMFFENWGGFDLKATWGQPGGTQSPIGPDDLFRKPD